MMYSSAWAVFNFNANTSRNTQIKLSGLHTNVFIVPVENECALGVKHWVETVRPRKNVDDLIHRICVNEKV